MSIKGSCACGAVEYESTGAVYGFTNCHCSYCRKATGADYSSVLIVAADGFNFTKGEGDLACYELEPGSKRYFCKHCGGPLISKTDENKAITIIRAGTIDGDPDIKPTQHIWVSDKAPWIEICDSLPQHAEFPAE